MQNFVQQGERLTLTAPYAVDAGDGAKVGAIFGVACSDLGSGDSGEFLLEGVVDLDKAAGAVSAGDRMYWDDSAKVCTTDSEAGMLIGVATAAALSGDATARVRLNEAVPNMAEGAQTMAALTDNSGGATADGTIGAVTLPDLSAWNGSVDPTAAQATAISAAITALTDAVKELATKQNAVIAALKVNGALK